MDRLETIHAVVGNVSKLTALSRGRNLFGYAPYPDEVIDGFCRNAIEWGLGIMRIFDALNDVNNVKSTIKYVKKYGGIADCAVCYTIDPHFSGMERFKAMLKGKRLPKAVFTDEYFLEQGQADGRPGRRHDHDQRHERADSSQARVGSDQAVQEAPVDSDRLPYPLHAGLRPGFVVAAIVAGADIVDTNLWNFAGGPAAPAIELIWIFCKKLGVDTGVNMEAVAKINSPYAIRKELNAVDSA